ncbi:MAG: hypothetical protein M1820_008556 [Bogoriella megaspora]|nr:MAG: hypothetical protein M1820_008556 [Bogoriella megaspora]
MDDLDFQDVNLDSQQLAEETPSENVFVAPSIDRAEILDGVSYSYYSPIPELLNHDGEGCVLGIDEAGRGPVLGPMVYAVFYLPISMHQSLLAETHHFDDSKVLTPEVRSSLMEKLCTPDTDLFQNCGWATTALSARNISAGMLKPVGAYNLNAQATDATVALINGILDRGVNIREVYIDTIGQPAAYQRKLERIFPTLQITVAAKADSLYPCVSAASVCAKVTRDAALELSYEPYRERQPEGLQNDTSNTIAGWGSGYPSDGRTSSWLKQNMDPIFGWGPECRFSWGTAKEMLEVKNPTPKVDWPVDSEDDSMKVTNFFSISSMGNDTNGEVPDELCGWFGRRVTDTVF